MKAGNKATMLETSNKNLDRPAKRPMERRMSDVALAQNLMRGAFPPERHGNAKAAIWAAYRALKLSTERRARAIWNGEARMIRAHEMDALRNAELEQARRERTELRARLDALDARLTQIDEDFYGPTLQALREQARRQG
jgi:hypothetical protein